MKKLPNYLKVLILIVATILTSGIAGWATSSAVQSDWFENLEKPIFYPPAWVFGPAWTFLYTSMTIAAFLVWRKGSNTFGVGMSMLLHAIQLVFNLLWSIFFFYLQNPMLGLVDIALLLFVLILMLVNFRRVSKPAAWLTIPYILWVTFATLLNAAIVYLN